MQALLDAYRSGIAVQGVQISKTDPPTEVEEAFKSVSAAQQQAQSAINQSEGQAQQVLARAQGDAAAFDKVYAQYKLAPEVTRRRMYYETMERVLRQTDKSSLIALAVLVVVMMSSLIVVPETQQAVIIRTGEPVAVVNQFKPGQ